MKSINPHSGKIIRDYDAHSDERVRQKIERADQTFRIWRRFSIGERAQLMRSAGGVLRLRKSEFAELMADEMGKILSDGEAEIEKCASCCEFYADNAAKFLRDQSVATDAAESYVSFEPIGVVLAVMPWNFPFWQVFRFAAPSLIAGNVGLLKHASNVSGCALAIEEVFAQAGFPEGVFASLLTPGSELEKWIRHPLIKAVTLTGSTPAGRSVAKTAGEELKKTVLELGGSDPYVVLTDADLDLAIDTCTKSRLVNGGQSCIAAKRFIILGPIYREFEQRFTDRFRKICFGDPRVQSSEMGPMARRDLRDEIDRQVKKSIAQGARLLLGGEIPSGPGSYYPPTVLSKVRPGMVAFDDEIFGPVAALIEAKDEDEALMLANQSVFGLGAALFTKDRNKANRWVKELEAGSVFVNGLVKSDPRLPFGGVKQSGYGRELSSFGIHEFVNIKSVFHASAPAREASPPGMRRSPEARSTLRR